MIEEERKSGREKENESKRGDIKFKNEGGIDRKKGVGREGDRERGRRIVGGKKRKKEEREIALLK